MRRLIIRALPVFAILCITLFAPALCPYDPYQHDLSIALRAPCAEHLLGTDRYGRDMLSRVIAGSGASVFSAVAVITAAAAAGTSAGIISGLAGGATGSALMRTADACLALPGLVLALFISAILGGGLTNSIIALICACWPKYARLSHSLVASLKGQDFVLSARMNGLTKSQTAMRHILPNIAGTIAVTAALDTGTVLMELAALSFLGLGPHPPAAEWGSMMSQNRSLLQTCPWTVLAPGGAIFTAVTAFNLLADAVRDFCDTRLL